MVAAADNIMHVKNNTDWSKMTTFFFLFPFFFFKHFTMSKPGSSKKSNNAAINEKEMFKDLRHELCVPGK